VEARVVDAVQRREHAEQPQHSVDEHLEPEDLAIARREVVDVVPEREELAPVQLDQRPAQRFRELAQPLPQALDDAVVVEDEPFEDPARARLPGRLQILELDESPFQAALDLRNSGVDGLDADAAHEEIAPVVVLVPLVVHRTDAADREADRLERPFRR
jgi:hypothetical protein